MAKATITTKSGDKFTVLKDEFTVDYAKRTDGESERFNSNRLRDYTNALADLFGKTEVVDFDEKGVQTGSHLAVGYASGYTEDGKFVLVAGDDIASVVLSN